MSTLVKKPNIFIVGASGSGKSTCLRNMPSANTVIMNLENKSLPFKNLKQVPSKEDPNVMVMKPIITTNDFDTTQANVVEQFIEKLSKWMSNPKVKTIVIDSFTSLIEAIYRNANRMYSGFDVWKYYNEEIDKVVNLTKNSDKYIVWTGIDMVIDGANGIEERCIYVQGNQWKKKVEKEFVIVLFTEAKDLGDTTKYQFITNRKSNVTAKSPMDMLPLYMDNDLNEVIKKCDEFYGFSVPEQTTATA